jgi:toxoflavin biosynthesis protein ToxD
MVLCKRWPCYPANHSGHVRLPTEQEWQRAAVGDTDWDYSWGSDLKDTFANFGNNIGQPTPVGNYVKKRSPYHVVDIVGCTSVHGWLPVTSSRVSASDF